jgi:glutaredoxin
MAASRKSLLGLAALVLAVAGVSQWWAGYRQGSQGEQMASLAQAGDIQMLSSTNCAVCAKTRAWFAQHDVTFSECFIETDAACAARFEATRSPGTPVLLVRGQPQVGFDARRVLGALKRPS